MDGRRAASNRQYGFPVRDVNGRTTRWCVLLTDIDERKRAEDASRESERNLLIDLTERKPAEEALRESERKCRLLVETIPALMWRSTSEGELDYLNERAVEYLGHTAQSLTGGGWIRLVDLEHRDATVRRWLHSATTGSSSSYDDIYRIRRADGQYRWIQSIGEPFYDADGRIAHWYGVIIDIDDRMRIEQELRLSEARTAAILDSALECIVTIDHEGYTTKRDGMGIGLSVSRSIIERHHGRLWAERSDGPGATFAFLVPRDPENVTNAGPVNAGPVMRHS